MNKKFCKDTIIIGMLPNKSKNIATTKVVFSKIHDIEGIF